MRIQRNGLSSGNSTMALDTNFVLLIFVSVLATGLGSCPPQESIWPCTCSQNSLTCGTMTYAQLLRAFNAQRNHSGGRELELVHLKNYNFSYLPPGLLNGLTIKHLQVNTSALKSFHDRVSNKSAFQGVEKNSMWLTLNYHTNLIDDFDWSSLSPLKNLYNLFLSGTFSAIREPLPRLPTVVNFWLQNTDVAYIVNGAFSGLSGVNDLRVTNNKEANYTRSMFPSPASNLSVFITSSDTFLQLPEDYFQEMPSLTYVQIPSFAHNIPRLHVNGTVNLQSSRGLTCDCSLKWLLRTRDEGKVNILHAICARPESLYWRDVNTLTEKELCG